MNLVILSGIIQELIKAEEKHPNWPSDPFHQLAILTEESGEVAKAILDYQDGKATLRDIKTELMQTAAMCIRILKHLPDENL